MPGYSKLFLLAAVIGSAPTVAGMGDLLSSTTCETIEASRAFGISLSQALAAAGITSDLFPPDCDLDNAFDHFCSDEGLACAPEFTVPTLGAIDADSITEYQREIEEYANCWDGDGALRPLAACTDPSVFESMQQTITAAENAINLAITEVEGQIAAARDAGEDTTILEAYLNDLELAAAEAQRANAVTQAAKNGDVGNGGGRTGGGGGGGSSGSSSGDSGGGGADPGVIAGAVVGGLAGVGLIGYGLVQANVFSFLGGTSSAGVASNVAAPYFSEETDLFI